MEDKNFYYVFFIETHDGEKDLDVILSDKNKEKQIQIAPLHKKILFKNKVSYYACPYYVKIPNNLENYKIKLYLKGKEDENKNKLKYKILIKYFKEKEIKEKEIKNYIFLYNVKFKSKSLFFYPHKEYPLTLEEQFQIYIKNIREIFKDNLIPIEIKKDLLLSVKKFFYFNWD